MANEDREVQEYLRGVPFRMKRELARTIREEADGLAGAIRDAAKQGLTGNLKRSVRVRRGRNTLELVIEAGGPLTTREVRKGSGVTYDYSLANEYGNENSPAQPFFYLTARAREAEIRKNIEAAVERALK